MDQKNVYQFRNVLRNLYKNEANINGDLAGNILSLQDMDQVLAISENLSEYSVNILLSESCSNEECDEIITTIHHYILDFINQNRNMISVENNRDFEVFINSDLIFDCSVIGKQISISL